MIKSWLFSTPFIWVFTLNRGVITPTIVLSLILFSSWLLRSKRLGFRPTDFMLFASFTLVCVTSALLNYNEVRLTHLLAMSVTCALFYYFPRMYIISKQISSLDFSKSCALAALMYSAVIIVEFCSHNFFGLDFRGGLPMFFEDIPQSMFLGQFYRARGFASEPGHAMFSLIMLAILGFYFVSTQKNRISAQFYLSFVLIATLATASPVPFIFIPLSIALASFLRLIFSGTFVRGNNIFYMLIIGGFFVVGDRLFFGDSGFVQAQIFGKFSSFSMEDRLSRMDSFREFFRGDSVLFGLSPGASENVGARTQLSVYPLILMEVGLLGFSILILFISLQLFKVLKVGNFNGAFIGLVAILYAIFNGFVISNYYYPAFWLPFIFASLLVERSERVNGNA